MDPKTRRAAMMQQDAQDPLDEVQQDGGTVDVWLMDDQTIACDPRLLCVVLDAVDDGCQDKSRGGVRNRTTTHVIIYVNELQAAQQAHTWDIQGITQRATLNSPKDDLRTLGAMLGGKANRCRNVKAKLKVMQAMRQKLSHPCKTVVELKLAKHCLGESKSATLLTVVRHGPLGDTPKL